jgi:RecB family exonuclease
LLRLGGAERQALVARAVAAAARRLSPPHAPRLVALEAERAERLAGGLLDVECERAPFAVEGCEVRAAVTVGNIEIATCVDRIDRLAGGETLVVDYKSGRANLRDLIGERPNEPQLPLYATAGDAPAASGVAYGVLRNDQAGFVGVARAAAVAPGIVGLDAWRDRPMEATDWDALLAHWRQTLDRLARDFAAGNADVDPKDGALTCRYCHLAVLCRIDELRAGTREDREHGA